MASERIAIALSNGSMCSLTASVLYFYEYAITFDEEIRCIWCRRISSATVLFAVIRYAMLATSAVSLVNMIPVGGTSGAEVSHKEVCAAAPRVLDIFIILAGAAYVLFAALRMFALYGMSKTAFAVVLIIGLVVPCARIFFLCGSYIDTSRILTPVDDFAPSPKPRIYCYQILVSPLARTYEGTNIEWALLYIVPALRIHAVVFEVMLIGLTWKKTAFGLGGRDLMARTPFATTLMRNGTLYFATIAAAAAVDLVGTVAQLGYPGTLQLQSIFLNTMAIASSDALVATITAICVCRFILDLLAISLDETRSQLRSSQWKTIQFVTVAESIAGTFAADLVQNDSPDEG